MTTKTILIFSGPSGGHLFPALAFAEMFQKRHPDSHCGLVVTPRTLSFISQLIPASGIEIFYLPDFPFPPLFSLKAFSFLLKLAQGFWRTGVILRRVKPDAIVAFGTFVSFPGVVLGCLKNIPTVLHEQNVELGRANRWLIPFARKVAVSFPSTMEKLPKGKGVWVGNVLRQMMLEGSRGGGALRRASKKVDPCFRKARLLVLGGSQGSSLLNRVILQTFRSFSPEEKQRIAVIHITGRADFPEVERGYGDLGLETEVFPFSDEMPGLYRASDLVIARAGAGTIAEIALFGIPSILIPYPHAGSHQLANARYLADQGASCLIEENQLTPERLKKEIISLLTDSERARLMVASAARLTNPHAGERLVDEVEKFLAGDLVKHKLSGQATHDRQSEVRV